MFFAQDLKTGSPRAFGGSSEVPSNLRLVQCLPIDFISDLLSIVLSVIFKNTEIEMTVSFH
jgi:hypothetical protein